MVKASPEMEEARERIREKLTSPGDLEPELDVYGTEPVRIGVYHCIPYESGQPYSLELFKLYFTDAISRIPGGVFKKLYLDTYNCDISRENTALSELLEDCYTGEIDVIWTKNLSMIRRNSTDCLTVIERLAALDPPVGIIFHTDGLYSLNTGSMERIKHLCELQSGYSPDADVKWSKD